MFVLFYRQGSSFCEQRGFSMERHAREGSNTPRPVTITAGHLAHKSASPCFSASKIAKATWDTFLHETCAVIIATIAAPDLNASFLGKKSYHFGDKKRCLIFSYRHNNKKPPGPQEGYRSSLT
jgi:hypothetical protein